MSIQPNDGVRYLQAYLKLWKWMNRCLACGRLGYKPKLPEPGDYPTAAARNLRSYFPELPLNDGGLCVQCAASGDA